jgi:uncharacterized protein YjbJ (UPF0337 family)
MRKPNEDEIRGKIDEAAGTVKESIGRARGDVNMENEGADQRLGGKIEGGMGKARRKVSEGLDDLGDKLNK